MGGELSITIRLASASDGTALAALRWEFSQEDGGDAEENRSEFHDGWTRFWDTAQARGWLVWVAERDGQLIGNMWLQLVEKVPRPGTKVRYLGYLTNVYVTPEARGQEVGGKILAEVIAWAKTENLELLFVWPSSESVEFYKRAGFRVGASHVVGTGRDDFMLDRGQLVYPERGVQQMRLTEVELAQSEGRTLILHFLGNPCAGVLGRVDIDESHDEVSVGLWTGTGPTSISE